MIVVVWLVNQVHVLYGRPLLNGANLVRCVLSLTAVLRLRQPDVGAEKALYSDHAADTDIHLESPGVVLQALTLLGGARFITWCLRRSFLREYQRGPKQFCKCPNKKGPVPYLGLYGTHDKYRRCINSWHYWCCFCITRNQIPSIFSS